MNPYRNVPAAGWILLACISLAHAAEDSKTWRVTPELRTVAEQSDYRSTASSTFVVDFLEAVSREASHIQTFKFGTTFEGRPMMAATVARPSVQQRPTDTDPRLVVLINANIHSGECCGKEAMLRMLRELANAADHRWLDEIVLVIVPNYNADGNDNVAKTHRARQVGPINGMGMRPNAQQLDLNREYIKLESPEARALVGLMNRFKPHCFIDLHTTNGSWHRYQLTYDIVHNPAADPLLAGLMRGRMMPAVAKHLLSEGIDTFYYGNFNDDHTRWSTTDHRPRFGLDYVSLRGRISILSEAYAYITFRDRIEATHAFVSACLDYLTTHRRLVRDTLATVEQNTIERGTQPAVNDMVAIRARLAPFPGKVVVKGFDPPSRPPISADEIADGGVPKPPGPPHDYQVEFHGRFEPSLRVKRPFAYAIPARMPTVIERLAFHGVQLMQLGEPVELEVETYRVNHIEKARVPFQKHHTVLVDATASMALKTLPKGTVMVPTGQRLGNLVMYLLELGSDDGFVTWNLYDDELKEGQVFPIVRLRNKTTLPWESR